MSGAGRLLRRLDVRLAALVLAAEALVVAAIGAGLYALASRSLDRGFDRELRATARAFAEENELDERAAGLLPPGPPLPEAGEVPGRPTRVYIAWTGGPGGRTVAATPGAGPPPGWAGAPGSPPAMGPVELAGRRFRGVAFDLAPARAAPAGGEGPVVRVLYARRLRYLDERKETLRRQVAWIGGIFLLLSGPGIWLAVRRGLRPVRRLAGATDSLGEADLARRLDPAALPTDLAPLAVAVNALLARLGTAIERERRLSEDAAHELRTPVATLRSGIQAALLAPSRAGGEEATLRELLEDVTRLESLCESLLLSVAPPGPGAGPVPAALFDERVRGAAADLRAEAERGGCTLEAPAAAAPPAGARVAASEDASRRILSNLVRNAIRHGGPGTRIEVRVEWEPSGAAVTVADDGPGVAPADEPRLFERFFRADRARSRDSGGAGLGLALCRSLAGREGGTVEFRRPEGRGCRFLWRAPWAEAAPTA